MYEPGKATTMAERFRGFLPVVVDVETGGFNPATDALLEIAAIPLQMDDRGLISPTDPVATHVIPFEGANLEPKSLEITGIDPWHPLRAARNEHDALSYVFQPVRQAVKENGCTRAILVGHNATLDLNFLNAAVERAGIRRNPFHPFSFLDTVTLGALAYGQTVLARASREAGLGWESEEAHSAVYDTRMTAQLFCAVINRWEELNAGPVTMLHAEK
ncbi:MAG: ribonuclease T [Halofilum sp. (in: g-proteobacteria)]